MLEASLTIGGEGLRANTSGVARGCPAVRLLSVICVPILHAEVLILTLAAKGLLVRTMAGSGSAASLWRR